MTDSDVSSLGVAQTTNKYNIYLYYSYRSFCLIYFPGKLMNFGIETGEIVLVQACASKDGSCSKP